MAELSDDSKRAHAGRRRDAAGGDQARPADPRAERSDLYDPVVLSTGQHEQMVGEIFALAGITVDAHLWVGGARSRLNERVATLMQRIEDYVIGRYADLQGEKATRELRRRPAAYPLTTIVHGDTSSAFAAALASFHLRIPVVHVEAGLRTGGLNLTPFPEELNRQLITVHRGAAPRADREERGEPRARERRREIRSS